MKKTLVAFLVATIIVVSFSTFMDFVSFNKMSSLAKEANEGFGTFEAEEINGYNLKDYIPFGK